jgi:glucose/arabinose dehydrogenase
LIGAVALAAGLGAGILIWTMLRSSQGAGRVEPEQASVAPVALANAAPQLEVAVAPSGRVVVDAAPWGEVVAVIASDGKRVAPPPRASTPLVLTLAPGVYEVQVARPGEGQEQRSCRVTVAASGLERCRVELGRVTGRQYFKESGWWQ